mmetsp:Transcript_29777/g.53516  ORF Transcript_29777/g.53516 Transcript_29777/m.53516 type:complete len:258 (-) Transcript_29777:1072-1845(-)
MARQAGPQGVRRGPLAKHILQVRVRGRPGGQDRCAPRPAGEAEGTVLRQAPRVNGQQGLLRGCCQQVRRLPGGRGPRVSPWPVVRIVQLLVQEQGPVCKAGNAPAVLQHEMDGVGCALRWGGRLPYRMGRRGLSGLHGLEEDGSGIQAEGRRGCRARLVKRCQGRTICWQRHPLPVVQDDGVSDVTVQPAAQRVLQGPEHPVDVPFGGPRPQLKVRIDADVARDHLLVRDIRTSRDQAWHGDLMDGHDGVGTGPEHP